MIAREKLHDYFLVKKFCKGVMSASRWSELFPCLSLLSYNKLDIHWPTKDSLYRTIWHVRDPWIYTSERVWSRTPGGKRTRGSAPTPSQWQQSRVQILMQWLTWLLLEAVGVLTQMTASGEEAAGAPACVTVSRCRRNRKYSPCFSPVVAVWNCNKRLQEPQQKPWLIP